MVRSERHNCFDGHSRFGRAGVIAALVAVSMIAGCGNTIKSSAERVAFDGHVFRASAKQTAKRTQPAAFSVTVNGVSKSFDGAREAGRHEGIRFCIRNFGSSRIDWSVGPDTEQLQVENDKLTFVGRCQRP